MLQAYDELDLNMKALGQGKNASCSQNKTMSQSDKDTADFSPLPGWRIKSTPCN